MPATSHIAHQLAEWSATLAFDSIPQRVRDECKTQFLNILAAVHAGHFSETGRLASKIVREWGHGKEATLIPSGEKTSTYNAIFGNTCLSMALDYDDYLFAGHTGHSAVLCTLALAEKYSLTGKEFLTAQAAANEIEGRIGAALVLGPFNGQLMSFLHAVGGAVIGARAKGLDAQQTASAIGLALAQPAYCLAPAFFGSDGKILLAAQTTCAGVMAAELAAGGLKGPADIIEHERGFLATFGEQPLLGAFGGLGKTWLCDTLSYKPYPGCAYLGAIIDCVLQLARAHDIKPSAVRSVEIATGPLALAMEALAAPYAQPEPASLVALNFSVGYNVAVALTDKELTPRQFLREKVRDPSVWELAGKVRLAFDETIAERGRASFPVRSVATGDGERYELDLDKADFAAFRMSLGARVRIEMEDGQVFEAEQEVPRGAAGRPAEERRQTVEEKFRRETRYTLRKEKMERAIDLIEHLEEASSSQIREIVRLCCSERV